MSQLRWVVLAVCACFFVAGVANGQALSVTDTTSAPIPGVGHDYIKLLSETVNPVTGSVSIRIEPTMPPGRGLTIPIAFQYDSSGAWYVQPGANGRNLANGVTGQFPQGRFTRGGWSITFPHLSRSLATFMEKKIQPDQSSSCSATTGYVFTDAAGASHVLGLSDIISYNGSNPTTACLDSHYQNFFTGGDSVFQAVLRFPGHGTTDNTDPGTLDGTPVIVGPDGTTYFFAQNWLSLDSSQPVNFGLPSQIEDTNGNVLAISNSSGTTSVTDTLGRIIFSAANFGTTVASGPVTLGNLTYNLTWETLNPTGSIPITYTPAGSAPGCGGPGGARYSGPAVQFITLPNNQTYQFSYDPQSGFLDKITFPSGGYVSYTWDINSVSEGITSKLSDGLSPCSSLYDTPAVSHRNVSFDGISVVLQQDFQYSTTFKCSGCIAWQTKTTTVTTHDLIRGTSSKKVYTYSSIFTGTPPNLGSGGGLSAVEQSLAQFDTSGALLETVTEAWNDSYELACELRTLNNGQIRGDFYTYTTGAQITDKKEFDYGQITSTSGCQPGAVSPPTATPTRETLTNYQVFAATPVFPSPSIFNRPCQTVVNGNGTRIAETDFFYDGTASSTACATSTTQSLPGTGSYTGHDEFAYGPTATAARGNLTAITRKCLQSCTDSTTAMTYDETGRILTKIDACGNATCSDMAGTTHTTAYSYSDNFDSNPTSSTNAYLTQITDPLGHISKFKYAYSDGQLIQSQDQNDINASRPGTTYLYNDSLRRLTETDHPDGGSTTNCYTDAGGSICSKASAPPFQVVSKKFINATQYVNRISVLDGMGHPTQTQLTSDPQGTVYGDTTYDGMGRVWKQSNPYRSGTDATTSAGTTTFNYDAIGRKISETEPDGSVITTAYCGPNTLVTDPTGKWRRSRADALGHLVEVDEPNTAGATVASTGCPGTGEPIWVTSYTNDVLGNLTQVVQNGSHTRTFTYDSLSRLLTSSNPEVGAITYTYDANSNVVTKKDARNITATYSYDALNRTTGVTYSNGDPGITYTYDQSACLGLSSCSNIGRRTSATDVAGSEAWAYQVDATNHRNVHVNQRTTNSQTKTSTYYLDLAGNLTQITYPTGRVVNYTYNGANRPITAADGSSGITYATGFQTPPANTNCVATAVCYTPQGTFYGLSIGQSSTFTGLNLNHSYNSRLQPNEFKASSTGGNVMDISYNFVDPASTHNAGHVYGISNNLDTTRSQTFTYDQLNRISGATTNSTFSASPAHCWGEAYGLDAWGNLQSISATVTPGYTGCSQESGFTKTADGNNHVSGFTYDTSGNTTNDGTYTYVWDGESQLKSANGVNYLYDGNGRRVAKSGSELYWYGSGGEILAETDAHGNTLNEYIFFGGQRIAIIPADPAPTVGGFEQGLSGWTPTTTNLTAQLITNPSSCHSGNNCLRLSDSVDPLSQDISPQSLSISVGQTATLDGWVFRETGTGNYSARWVMGIISTNGNAYPAPADDGTYGAWIHQTVSYTVPSWTVCPCSVQMYAQLVTPSGTLDTARFDDGVISVSSSSSGNGKPLYYVEDMLGTSRVMADSSGVLCYDADFYPYGGERTPYTNTCTQNVYKFEGKERDNETGNDDFGARYYSNRFGRWLSADWSSVPVAVPYANLTNPQTLNLYSMVSDDPESFADLDGHIAFEPLSLPDGTLIGGEGCPPGAPLCEDKNDKKDGTTASTTKEDPSVSASVVTGASKEVYNEAKNTAAPIMIVQAVETGNIEELKMGISLLLQANLQASNSTEKKAMTGTSIALLVLPMVGEVSVYMKTESAYVGITNNLARREAEHGEELVKVVGGLTRKQAKGVEQAIIEQKGLKNLTNMINSIAKNNPAYSEAVQFGRALLKSIGFN